MPNPTLPTPTAPDPAPPDTAPPDTTPSDTTPSDTTPPETATADTHGSSDATTSTTGTDEHSSTANHPARDSARRTRAGELEDRVWAALRRHAGATTAELAFTAAGSRSAVGKLLAAWAADGSAASTPGPKPRDARRWTAALTHPATPTKPATELDVAEPETSAEPNNSAEPETSNATGAADPETTAAPVRPDNVDAATSDALSETSSDGDTSKDTDDVDDGVQRDGAAPLDGLRKDDRVREADSATEDGATIAEDSEAAASRRGTGHAADAASVRGEAGDGAPGAPGPSAAAGHSDTRVGAEPARRHGPGRRGTAARSRSGTTRLPKGGLRGQVEDYLADTPCEHSPVQIGKVLGRSSGAIANALESLVESGGAVRTSDRPRRYSHPDHADAIDQTRRDGERDSAATDRERTRARGAGRGVCGVGTYVTVLAVLPLDCIAAVSTDEIADWVHAWMPAPVLFASAAHGVTRAALSAGAEPSDWPTTTVADTAADPNAPSGSEDPGAQLAGSEAAGAAARVATGGQVPSGAEIETQGRGDAEAGDGSGSADSGGDRRTGGVEGEQPGAASHRRGKP